MNMNRNSVWAVAEIVIIGVSTFLVYRSVIGQLGVGALGVWSLTLAATSIGRVVDPGTSNGLSRFAAIAYGRGEFQEASDYFLTAVVSTVVSYVCLSAAIFWPIAQGLSYALDARDVPLAQELLPYAICSFVLMNVNFAIQGALIGFQRSDLKSKTNIFCALLQLGSISSLLSGFGLAGLALAQLSQYALGSVLSILLVAREINRGGQFIQRSRFRLAIFKKLVSFGSRLQVISIVSFCVDPATRFIISLFGGSDAVGVFEVAQKYVLQVRQVIIAPAMTLVPVFADLLERRRTSELEESFRSSLSAVVVSGGVLMSLAVLASPLASIAVFGGQNVWFLIVVSVMSVAWLLNILAAPSYLFAIARGHLAWNFYGHLIALVGGSTLGYLFGIVTGGWTGAFLGCLAGLVLGNVLNWIFNSREMGLPLVPSTADILRLRTWAFNLVLSLRERGQ